MGAAEDARGDTTSLLPFDRFRALKCADLYWVVPDENWLTCARVQGLRYGHLRGGRRMLKESFSSRRPPTVSEPGLRPAACSGQRRAFDSHNSTGR